MARAHKSNHGRAILVAAFAILFFNTGARFIFGVLLKPMQEDLGWSRSSLSLAMTINMFASSLALPLVGRIFDRYSIKWALVVAVAMASAGMGILGWASAKWQIFLLYGVLFALGNAGFSIAPMSVLVTRWFGRGRALASSVAISGGAMGQVVMIAVLASFLLDLGWRDSYRILGLATLLVVMPLVLFLIPSRQPVPDSNGPNPRQAPDIEKSIAPAHPESIRMFLGARSSWLLATTYAVCGFQDWFVGTHLVAFATDEGMGSVMAGNLLALMGIMGMAGVLLFGYLSDTYGPSKPTAASFILRAAIFSLAMISQSTPAITVFALLYGFTFFITAPLAPVFVSCCFGGTHLGSMTGGITMIHQMAGGLGAFVGGVIFDNLGDYHWAMALAFSLSIVAAVTSLLIREGSQSGLAQVAPA